MRLTARSASFGVAAFVLSLVLGVSTADAQADVRALLEEGYSLYQQGDLDGAKQRFDQALVQNISSTEALEWVERVGYAKIIEMMANDNAGLAKALKAIEEITSTEVRRRTSDEARVRQALDEYFSASWDEALRKRHTMVQEFGHYLVPGLVTGLGSSEQEQRVDAIQALRELNYDAVIPLCVAASSENPRIQQGCIAALKAIKHEASLGTLKRLAETASDPVTRQEALEAVKAINAAKAGASAYDLLVGEAGVFYSNTNYLNPTYHEPILFELEGEGVSYRTVGAWELNELRAEQRLVDALQLDSSAMAARVLYCSNNLARWDEYQSMREQTAAAAERGEASEADQAELTARMLEMAQVRNRAFASTGQVLLGAAVRGMGDNRPEVAAAAIRAYSSLLPTGQRAASVPGELTEALTFPNRGVRFAAAEAIAHMNPTGDFANSGKVVAELLEGLTKAGGYSALTVFPSNSDALKVRDLLRTANFAAANVSVGFDALERAFNVPHDVIVLGTNIGEKIPTSDFIRRMRNDYRTKATPILVIAEGDDLNGAEATFENDSLGVQVVNRSIDNLRFRDDYLKPITEASSGLRARSADIAARSAGAIKFLASRDTRFDLSAIGTGLAEVLENRNDEVRIPACDAVRALGVKSAQANLVAILDEGEAASEELRVAALRALGAINRGNSQIDAPVARVLEAAMTESNVKIATAASEAYGETAISPAVMKIKN